MRAHERAFSSVANSFRKLHLFIGREVPLRRWNSSGCETAFQLPQFVIPEYGAFEALLGYHGIELEKSLSSLLLISRVLWPKYNESLLSSRQNG